MTTVIKPRFFQTFSILLFLGLTPLLFGCEQLATSTAKLSLNVTSIDSLPKRKADTRIYVKGTVESHAPFVGAGAYQLQDNTGNVWIFTTDPLPPLGQEMLLRGQVRHERISLQELPGEDIGGVYLKELERLQEPSASPENSDSETTPLIPRSQPVVEEKD